MPPRNWKLRIADILQCIRKIESFTKGYNLENFRHDEKTIDSVLRNLEIIGEATRHVPVEIKARYPGLPWVEMLAMRNIVIHKYHGVDLSIIWQTVREGIIRIGGLPILNEALTGVPAGALSPTVCCNCQ